MSKLRFELSCTNGKDMTDRLRGEPRFLGDGKNRRNKSTKGTISEMNITKVKCRCSAGVRRAINKWRCSKNDSLSHLDLIHQATFCLEQNSDMLKQCFKKTHL